MKGKRFVSLFAATAMVIATVAGCGGGAQPAGDSTQPAGDSSKPAATEEKKDDGAAAADTQAASGETMQIEVYDAAANYQGLQTGWFDKVVKDRFNIDLNIIAPQVAGDAIYQTRTSSGNLGDIVVLDSVDFADCVKAGLIKDITADLPNYSNLNGYIDQINVYNSGLEGNSGQIYGIPTQMMNTSPTSYSEDVIYSSPLLRWDYYSELGMPDIKGREAVFRVHSKNKPLGKDVDIKTLAKCTPGFTPADIENMMNEAALLTARRSGSEIHMDDLEEAITRVIAGPKKKSKVMSDKEKRLTAFHEAGHAVVMRSIPGSDPVHQVTIMPRGRAGGFTMQLPEEDKYYMTKGDMINEIRHLLGGRVAEALVMGDISTGASNDLERATKIAHDMVAKYGMSETIGPLNYSSADEVFLGRDFTSKQNYSEELASKIDKEVHDIMTDAYAATEKILLEHSAELHRVAEALLEMETLDADQFEALYTNTSTVEELETIQKEADAARAEKERLEAEKKAFLEAEEKRRLEEQMRDAMEKGKRVAVMDEKGNIIFRDASELRKEKEAAQKKGSKE